MKARINTCAWRAVARLLKTRMKNSQPRGLKEEMSDVHEYAETTCARGNCLTLQIAVSCCKSVDTLSIILL